MTSASLTAFAQSADVQESDGEDSTRVIEKVVVVAQKRAQSAQDVPLAITAFTGEIVEDQHIGEFTDIFSFTPGLVSAPDYATSERTSIRGLGSAAFTFGFDPHVGVFVNGVHQGRNGAQTSALFDVERVEVVKGPVNALYGRSAIAGAINIINNEPVDAFEGDVQAEISERNGYDFTGVLNVPVTDNLYFRGGIHVDQQDGFYNNVANGETIGDTDSFAVRAAVKYEQNLWDAKLTVNYEDRTDVPNIHQATGSLADQTYFGFPLTDYILDPTLDTTNLAGPFGDNYNVATDLDPYIKTELFDITGEVNVELNDITSLKAITSYRDIESRYLEDYDGNAIPDLTYFGPYEQNSDQKVFQQEFQLLIEPANDWVWVLGASYFDEDLDGYIGSSWSETLNYFSSPTTLIQEEFGTTDGAFSGWSLFGDVTIPLGEKFELTVGGRYNYDKKRLTQYVPDPADLSIFPNNNPYATAFNWPAIATTPVTSEADWDKVTWRAALSYAATDDLNFYASWAQGFKAGAIDALSFEADVPIPAFAGVDVSDPTINGRPAVADPESSDSYEIGMKGMFFDNSVQLNTAAFYYVFEDQQQLVSQGASYIVQNVGEVVGQGLEAEVRWLPTNRLDLSATLALLDTEIKEDEFNPANVGTPKARSPEVTASLIATYTIPLESGAEVFINGSYSYQDEMRVSGNPDSPYIPSYSLVNGRIGYDSVDDWGVSLFVENLTDEFVYYSLIESNGFGNTIQDTRFNFGQPRTFGASIYYRF
ncbi:TonB-dependent receptor [Henriciella litoralis]|uniref:TonB-dependent receptor n=1 Tax=Henriciella litoralis TaxID=568102 RepID=UPI00146B5113|nr:TonB-dependent receptor [Henriciella litoralis]